MKNNRFERFLNNILSTQTEEISCTECFDLVSHFVDLEISGGKPELKMPKVVQHLHQCTACHEEYETLRDLRLLEEEGGLPSVDELKDSIG